MSAIRAVVFDCDGVLLESVDVKSRAFALLFQKYGDGVVRQVVEYHLQHGGVSRMEKIRFIYAHILRESLSPVQLQDVCEQFQHMVVEHVIRAPWVAGAEEALAQLHQRNYALFVLSGTPASELQFIMAQRGIQHYFQGLYGSPPEKAALIRRLCVEHHFLGPELLMVGDSSTDFEAAQAVGASFLARSQPDQQSMWARLGVSTIPDLHLLPERVPVHVS